ncbi:hypothetical protein [Comamonas humi]
MIESTRNTPATIPWAIDPGLCDGGGLAGHAPDKAMAAVAASSGWLNRLQPWHHCYSVREPAMPGVDGSAVRLPAMFNAAAQPRLHQHPQKQAGQASPVTSGFSRGTKVLASKNIAGSASSKRGLDRNVSKSIDDKALTAPKKEAIQGRANRRRRYVCSPQRFAMSPSWGAQGNVASMGSRGECDE